ncbi:unnamed protein product, partial [Owenia fusiformis]
HNSDGPTLAQQLRICWPNVGCRGWPTVAMSIGPTLVHRRYVHWPNVGPLLAQHDFKLRWPIVGPLIVRRLVGPTLVNSWSDNFKRDVGALAVKTGWPNVGQQLGQLWPNDYVYVGPTLAVVVGPPSLCPSVQRWSTVAMSIGPTLVHCWPDTISSYIGPLLGQPLLTQFTFLYSHCWLPGQPTTGHMNNLPTATLRTNGHR